MFDFEGAAPSCSTLHFGLPWPVLVAVQPFGAAPSTSASKLTGLSAMTLASIKQRSAAVITTVFIVMAHSVTVVLLELTAVGRKARYDALRHFTIVIDTDQLRTRGNA